MKSYDVMLKSAGKYPEDLIVNLSAPGYTGLDISPAQARALVNRLPAVIARAVPEEFAQHLQDVLDVGHCDEETGDILESDVKIIYVEHVCNRPVKRASTR